jgi:hypothetical protein
MDPNMAPPVPRAQSTQNSVPQHYFRLVSDWWTSIRDDKQTIRSKIAQHELALEYLFELSDRQGEFAREIDGSDVAAWPAKYNAWWRRRHTLVEIQDVSPI